MCMQLSVTRRTTPVSQECTDRAISIVFSSNFTFGGITKGEGGNAWNFTEQIIAPDYDVPPTPLSLCSASGLRSTVLFTGENLSWKSASSSGERPYKNTHK